jgi:hypothetical protein
VIIVSVVGWESIAVKKKKIFDLYTAKILLTLILLSHTAVWMILNNPHQYLYFNSLAGNVSLEKKWEMDYWGLGNKEGLQYIFSRNSNSIITIGVASFTPFDMSLKALPNKYSKRLSVVSISENPDYIVNNFRLAAKPLMDFPGYSILKIFTVDNSRYLEIWERNK